MSGGRSLSRRGLLAGAGLAAGAALVAGSCTDDDAGGGGTTAGGGGNGGAGGRNGGVTGDLAVAEFGAGLEVLAVSTYQAALEAAGAGTLGEVPPAVTELLTRALAHHEAHLAAWNEVVTAGGRPAVTAPNAELKPAVDAGLGTAKSAADVSALARILEETAAATYLDAVPTLEGDEAVRLAASIQAVDAKHVAVLNFVLGEYPVPDVFAKTDKAARPG